MDRKQAALDVVGKRWTKKLKKGRIEKLVYFILWLLGDQAGAGHASFITDR